MADDSGGSRFDFANLRSSIIEQIRKEIASNIAAHPHGYSKDTDLYTREGHTKSDQGYGKAMPDLARAAAVLPPSERLQDEIEKAVIDEFKGKGTS